MAHIKSRKHAAARPSHSHVAAVGLALASLSVHAADPVTAPAAQAAPTAADSTLPPVNVQGSRNAPTRTYKADTVSSPKFTQPILNTPQTITVVKKELLRDQAVSNLSEALANTPGITFTMGENGNTTTGDSIFMRGFDTSGSIFLDGIRDLGTISRDVFNTEQIEIVKGPSGSDNGRGSPTGYINLSSKVPSLEEAYGGTITVGSAKRVRLTADLNRPLDLGIPGSAVRLNVMSDESDKLRRNVASNERWGVAPSLAFGLGTATRAYINLLHIRQNNVPDGGIPAIGFPGFTTSIPTADADMVAADQRTILNGVASAGKVSQRNFYGSTSDHDDVRVDMITTRFEHDLTPTTTIRNVSRYGRTSQQYVLTGITGLGNFYTTTSGGGVKNGTLTNPATWTVTRSRQGKDQENEILTNQTSLKATVGNDKVKNTISTGVEFIYERQSNVGFTTSGTSTIANLYNPNINQSFAAVVPSGAYTKGNTTTAAIYAFDTLELGKQWLINAGLRYEKYKTEFVSLPAATATSQTATLLGKTDDLLTWKLGTVFKPVTNGSIYVAFATAQKPPGSDNFTLNAPPSGTTTTSNINNPNLDPQKAESLEIGTKWELLDNRLVLSAAAFDTKNKNDQASRDPVTGEVTQYGEKKVRGLEFGAAGALSAAWQINAGLAYMDTSVTAGSSASQQGASINYSPKLTFTSFTSYKLPFGLTLGAGARYVDTQATQINNGTATATGLLAVPSYWVFDAMAGYELTKNLSLQLNVTNVADKEYISAVNSGRSRYTLGAPRAALLTLNVRY